MIKDRAEAAKLKIAEGQRELDAVQSECSHPMEARSSVSRSNTGNYDPSQDCYWVEYHCFLCDKCWSEDR